MGPNSRYFLERAKQMYQSVALTELQYTVREGQVLEKKLISKRATGGRKGRRTTSTGRKIWRVVSKPGEPPRRRSGKLWDSIDTWVDTKKLVGRIGSNYVVRGGRRRLLLWMEKGTKAMAKRPSLQRMLKQITAERVKRLRELCKALPEN